jgi:hypothetical protein
LRLDAETEGDGEKFALFVAIEKSVLAAPGMGASNSCTNIRRGEK